MRILLNICMNILKFHIAKKNICKIGHVAKIVINLLHNFYNYMKIIIIEHKDSHYTIEIKMY